MQSRLGANVREIASSKVRSNPSMYSQAVAERGLLFLSGQVPRDASGSFVTGDFEAEVRCAFDNARAILDEAGTSFSDVCKVNAYLSDPALFDEFNRIYGDYFPTRPLPARTTLVTAFVRPEVRFEVDLVAALPSARDDFPDAGRQS